MAKKGRALIDAENAQNWTALASEHAKHAAIILMAPANIKTDDITTV